MRKHVQLVLALLTLAFFTNDLVGDAVHDLVAQPHAATGLLCSLDDGAEACSPAAASSESGDSSIAALGQHHGHAQCAVCSCALHNGAALHTVAHIRVGPCGTAHHVFPKEISRAPEALPAPIDYPPQLG